MVTDNQADEADPACGSAIHHAGCRVAAPFVSQTWTRRSDRAPTSLTMRILLISVLTLLSFAGAAAQSAANIEVSGRITPATVKAGHVVRAQVTIDVPAGLYVQSNKPLDQLWIPTTLRVQLPSGMRFGAITYPRAVNRNLGFAKGQVAVYEGRAVIHFDITVAANYAGSSGDIRARLRFQACNKNSCSPPATREVQMSLNVER
jgi:DsbC/DsbD-like thiol-disulfide interchange protein